MSNQDTYSNIQPFTGPVDGNGNGYATITHSIHGLAWVVVQVGVSLQKPASSPQVAAIVNGIPLVSSAVMVRSVFASLPGVAPIAMTTEFSGVPYPVLEAGDRLVVGVTGATPGDVLTVGAFVNEVESPAAIAARNAAGDYAVSYVPRSGRARWQR